VPYKVHAARVPSTSRTVHRMGSLTVGNTIYTVPAGKTLTILAAYVCAVSSGLVGTAQLGFPSEDDGAPYDLIILKLPATSGLVLAMPISCEVRVPAGTAIVAGGTNLTSFSYGMNGYIESV